MTEERCHICGEPASYTCNECKRPVCAKHHLGSGYDIWAGACQQCMEKTEQRTWEILKARQKKAEQAEDSPAPDPPAPAVPAEPPAQTAPAGPPPEDPPASHRGNIVRRLFSRGGQRQQKGPSPPDIDLHLRGLLGEHQDRVFTYLGRPEHVADLSMRGGPLADKEIYNLEYYSKGLRFYRGEGPEILSIHFIHSSFDQYRTYPREILPGLRVGMTRWQIDTLLGMPKPDAGSSKWKSYATDTLPTIDNLEVLYADADNPDAESVIIAIG
jgi:hypothetical protein